MRELDRVIIEILHHNKDIKIVDVYNILERHVALYKIKAAFTKLYRHGYIRYYYRNRKRVYYNAWYARKFVISLEQ